MHNSIICVPSLSSSLLHALITIKFSIPITCLPSLYSHYHLLTFKLFVMQSELTKKIHSQNWRLYSQLTFAVWLLKRRYSARASEVRAVRRARVTKLPHKLVTLVHKTTCFSYWLRLLMDSSLFPILFLSFTSNRTIMHRDKGTTVMTTMTWPWIFAGCKKQQVADTTPAGLMDTIIPSPRRLSSKSFEEQIFFT